MVQVPTWKDDIERMLEEYEQSKMTNIVNIKRKTDEYIAQYKTELFEEYQGISIQMDDSAMFEEQFSNKIEAK